ncbi:MAG: hypothetical protein EAX86_02475 [Candidatus Heimdallarchaeota archaeon]|nr:hypothetical protein [Candidatus Heimdallarchaeota archaeon]
MIYLIGEIIMPKKSTAIIGLIFAAIGFIIPSFLLVWTGTESTSMILGASYIYIWGFFETSIGIGSIGDSSIHFFNINWFIQPDNISQGSELIDFYLNIFAVGIYPGNFSSNTLSLSGLIFGISLLLTILGLIFGLIKQNIPKFSGTAFLLSGTIALMAVFLIWGNITNLTFIGGGVEENFFPIPLGCLMIIGAGIWNIFKA